ncbi:MAG: deaminase [Marmoricola sp.]|nr:deaminase [Marmoricola sp.]
MGFADDSRGSFDPKVECMRKVVAYTLVSLDGVAEDPDQFLFDFDPVMLANLTAVIGTQDTVLLGRAMYEEWSDYWPSSTDQPFADFINNVDKYVATATPLTREWRNAEAIRGRIDEFVRELKTRDGGDIGVHGSIALTQSLFAAGLIDELQLVIAPRVAGRGRRLFEEGWTRSLALVDAIASPTGSLLVHYTVSAD